jgi:hypothetical protein
MKSISAKRAIVAAALALLAGLLLSPRGTTHAQTANSVGGQAFGTLVQTPTALLGQSPLATLPGPGMADASAASVGVPGVLTANTLQSIATGAVGENASSAQSSAVLSNVSILNGLITANAVRGLASSASNGTTASSNGAGSGFAGLVVGGVAVGDSPAPNQQIALPGVGSVTLNEQSTRGDGRTSSGLTVNMIHVRLVNLLGAPAGDIIAGSAASDAAFVR